MPTRTATRAAVRTLNFNEGSIFYNPDDRNDSWAGNLVSDYYYYDVDGNFTTGVGLTDWYTWQGLAFGGVMSQTFSTEGTSGSVATGTTLYHLPDGGVAHKLIIDTSNYAGPAGNPTDKTARFHVSTQQPNPGHYIDETGSDTETLDVTTLYTDGYQPGTMFINRYSFGDFYSYGKHWAELGNPVQAVTIHGASVDTPGIYTSYSLTGLTLGAGYNEITIGDPSNGLNYTYVGGASPTNSQNLIEWAPVVYPGAPSQTNYTLALSDATDNDTFTDQLGMCGSRSGFMFISTFDADSPDDASYVGYVFNRAMDSYIRYDIIWDGATTSNSVLFHQDIAGNFWLLGDCDDASLGDTTISFLLNEFGDDGVLSQPEWSDQPGAGSQPDINRVRAWTFTLDGHDYYVLRLGENYTLVYDITTQQWAQWKNEDWEVWRAGVGFNWGSQKIVAGDIADGQIWNIDPVVRTDDSGHLIESVVTGGLPMRGLDAMSNSVLLTASTGEPSDFRSDIQLETSDDNGRSYQDQGTLDVDSGDYNQPKWLGIGQISAPGRVFRLTDRGAFVRIDGLDTLDG